MWLITFLKTTKIVIGQYKYKREVINEVVNPF